MENKWQEKVGHPVTKDISLAFIIVFLMWQWQIILLCQIFEQKEYNQKSNIFYKICYNKANRV